MNLFESIINSGDGEAVNQIASQLGLSPDQTRSAIKEVLPSMQRSMQLKEEQGNLDSLLDLMNEQKQYEVMNDPQRAYGSSGVERGNGILGELFGTKDVSRAVASHASATTGISATVLKALLPIVANMVMGALTQQRGSSRGQASNQGLLGILDFDGDGSSIDDILSLAGRMMR